MQNNSQIVFMFGGQGSQYYQMGRAFYEQLPTFRHCMQYLDQIVLDISGVSVIDTLYDDASSKATPFDQIKLTHPAIFMVEYAMARTLLAAGIEPSHTLGTSMGSYAAAVVSGCLSADDAMQTICIQAELTERFCDSGTMIAVLADPALADRPPLRGRCEVAAYNFDGHFVMSTRSRDIKTTENFLLGENISFQRLPVQFPFHSPWMDKVEVPFLKHLHAIPFGRAHVPVVCCAKSSILNEISFDHFWNVTRQPILFQKTIRHIEDFGFYHYIDLSPNPTLITFLKYLLPGNSKSSRWPIMSPFSQEIENLKKIQSGLQTPQPV